MNVHFRVVVKTLLDEEWPWSIETIDQVISEYIKNRYKKFGYVVMFYMI